MSLIFGRNRATFYRLVYQYTDYAEYRIPVDWYLNSGIQLVWILKTIGLDMKQLGYSDESKGASSYTRYSHGYHSVNCRLG